MVLQLLQLPGLYPTHRLFPLSLVIVDLEWKYSVMVEVLNFVTCLKNIYFLCEHVFDIVFSMSPVRDSPDIGLSNARSSNDTVQSNGFSCALGSGLMLLQSQCYVL